MDSNLLKTKSIEQLVGDAEHGGKALKRTLTAMDLTLLGIGAIIGTGIFVLTGTAAANQAGPGHRAVVRARRPRLRLRGALLRRVRGDDSDLRQRLYLRLRHARRDLRVDDRLGPDPRIRRRLDDGRGRLERLLPADSRRASASTCRSGCRRRPTAGAGRAHQPARRSSSCSPSWCCWSSACARARASTPSWSPSSSRRCCSSSSSASAYVKPENWSPFMPYGFAGVIDRQRRSSSSPTSGSTRSRRPPRRPRIRAATCRSASSRRSSSARCCISSVAGHPDRDHPGRPVQGRRAVPERAGRLRAARDQPGLGGGSRVGRRGRRHHERAARHAA